MRALAACSVLFAGLLLAGCGGDDGDSAERVDYRYTATPLEAGAALTDADVDEAVAVLAARLETFGVENAEVEASPVSQDRAGTVTIAAAESDGDQVERAVAPRELRFYDWEASVVGGEAGFAGPEEAQAFLDSREECVEGGCLIVEDQQPNGTFVIRDVPVVTGDQIVDPRIETSEISGNEVVAFELDERGQAGFGRMIDAMRARGGSTSFAMVFNGRVISRPAIDFSNNPEGLDVSQGLEIEGGLSAEETESMVDYLESGPLPIVLERAE